MNKRFTGKIAVVTGAGGKNIGRALAIGFAKEGARTVLVGRTESSLAEVAAKIEAEGGECIVVPADITLETDVSRLFAEVAERFGAVDILLNNAAQKWNFNVLKWKSIEKRFVIKSIVIIPT